MSDHENHPGAEVSDCVCRIQIDAHLQGSSSNGYACSITGGHCIPDRHCDNRRAMFKQHQLMTRNLIPAEKTEE
jgi:hypothetical protein